LPVADNLSPALTLGRSSSSSPGRGVVLTVGSGMSVVGISEVGVGVVLVGVVGVVVFTGGFVVVTGGGTLVTGGGTGVVVTGGGVGLLVVVPVTVKREPPVRGSLVRAFMQVPVTG
jgi:hypothetical protein